MNWDRYDRRTELIWRISLVLIAFGGIIGALTSCGDHPVPEHGTVTDAKFTPAWMQWMPGTTSCSNNVCTTSPGYPIFWPDEWRLEVTDLKNKDWVGTVEVSQSVFDRCNLRELWPECSTEGSGEERNQP